MAASLAITSVDKLSNTDTPHLMPFHIEYSGPAPISTYFRIKPTTAPTFGRDTTPTPTKAHEGSSEFESQKTVPAEDSQTTLAATSSLASVASASTAVDVEMETTNDDAGAADPESDESPRHFSAAFRGRGMHGTLVDLPAGYAGLILRAPDDTKGKGKGVITAPASRRQPQKEEAEKPKGKKGRAARRAKRAQAEAEAMVVLEEAEETGAVEQVQEVEETDAEERRVLQPVGTFGSFVLWNPDIPVEEGRDEYLRSLSEWTRLAAEIHQVEE